MKKLIITVNIMLAIFTLIAFSDMNVNKPYAAEISNNNTNINTNIVIKTATKHSVIEVITLVQNSIYNPLNNQWINNCMNEDGDVYRFYSDRNLNGTWQVLIIDTKGNADIQDDEIINTYNLDYYTFNDTLKN